MNAHCTYGDTQIIWLLTIYWNCPHNFMASIVKNAAIHYVSILPNFNFYGLDNNHPAITSSDLEAVSWSHSIFGKCAFCKN